MIEHYTSLVERSLHHFKTMSADDESMAAFTRSHNFILDFELLRETIAARPEAKVLSLAIREYQFALYALAAANYRHAFISLRLFFELALSTVQFSSSELKLRRWLANKADIVWSDLVNDDTGVYAKLFVSAFEPELSDSSNQMLTTLTSYGNVPPERQAAILKRQRVEVVGPNANGREPDAGTIQSVLAHLAKSVSHTA